MDTVARVCRIFLICCSGWLGPSLTPAQAQIHPDADPAVALGLKTDQALATNAVPALEESAQETNAVDPEIARWMRDGTRQMRLGRYEKAVESFNAVLEKDPGNQQARFSLGTTYIKLRQFDRALELLEGLLQDFPNDFTAKNNLAWLYATAEEPEIRNPAKAVSLAQDAAFIAPGNYHVWSTLAEAHYQSGRYDRALRAAEQAMELIIQARASEVELEEYQRLLDKCRKAASALSVAE